MKKKIITIIIFIIAIVLLFPIPFRLKDGGSIEFRALLYTITKYHKLSDNPNQMYINGIGIEIFGIEIFNNTNYDENQSNNVNSNNKVIISNDKIDNIYLLDKFLDNTDKYNKNNVSDTLEIVTFTIEGGEILTTLQYIKETDEFNIIRDNTKDMFASEENRKIDSKVYSNKTYNLVKKVNDDYVYLILEADNDTENIEDVIILSYDKDLEKNKDTSRTKVKEVYLTAEETEINQLVRYNGILYGKSYGMIDYAGNPNGPIGTINKLIGEEYLPDLNGETNSEKLLNSLVDGANEKSMVLIYNNEAVLYNAIDESTDNFEIIFNGRKDLGIKTIISKDETDKYSYNIFSYGGDIKIKIDNVKYDLKDALLNSKITMEEIISKANENCPNALSYKDGGSIEYHYEEYTILKFHTLDGNRDVYIGTPQMTMRDVS